MKAHPIINCRTFLGEVAAELQMTQCPHSGVDSDDEGDDIPTVDVELWVSEQDEEEAENERGQ